MKRPVITLLTDFGLIDHYVAAMKGVILNICPDATLVDVSHEVTPFAIPEAAYTLAQTWRNFPPGTVHLAVVDPGVGGPRRAIAAEIEGHRFVVPDNGLLTMVLDNNGGVQKVCEITAKRYFQKPVSDTFHGRDIFSPIAAHLAAGLPFSRLGRMISNPIQGNFAKPVRLGLRQWKGIVLKIDRFGNVISNLDWETFNRIQGQSFKLKLGARIVSHFYPTFSSAPKGQLFALRGSSGYVEVSLNQSDAAKYAGVQAGSAIRLTIS